MVPAEGGASPEAMLLASMPTGSFSMKLLNMVQAGFQAETQHHNKPNLSIRDLSAAAPFMNGGDVTVLLLPPSGSTP